MSSETHEAMHAASKLVGGERLRRQVAAGILRARLQELDRIVKGII